jgi:lysophospholipase L1-like esterase
MPPGSTANLALKASIVLNILAAVVIGPRLWARWADSRDQLPTPAPVIHRTTLFDELRPVAGSIVFAGDSLVQMCEWAELLGDHRVVNRGVFDETTATLRDHVGVIGRDRPSAVFLMVGINDLAHGRPMDAITADYTAIVQSLSRKTPRVVVQSVLPVNHATYKYRVRSNDIVVLNAGLRDLAARLGATYLDVGARLTDASGDLGGQFTADGVHLNGEAYRLWRDSLLPLLPNLDKPVD